MIHWYKFPSQLLILYTTVLYLDKLKNTTTLFSPKIIQKTSKWDICLDTVIISCIHQWGYFSIYCQSTWPQHLLKSFQLKVQNSGSSTLTALKYKMHMTIAVFSNCLFNSILIQGVYWLYSTILINMRRKYFTFMKREGQDEED